MAPIYRLRLVYFPEKEGCRVETGPAIKTRQQWHIITSEEVARIRELLALMEQDGAERCRAGARELADLITLVERRLI